MECVLVRASTLTAENHGPYVEMHAVELKQPEYHYIARVAGQGDDVEYRCMCLLAESVGVDLEG
jgi:hypothetical protein